ncbi:MAG: AAA family ATPase [Saprospiraceae bacterium]|jgi:uridine kinase|nr:AAA family ATPase [Saprospiraceae bacterium]HRD81937.1 uridine kinase [Saprospiraceae bacterium]HRJ13704.1 uridine kinase [Saprospiraceae bacterium]HRK82621.1 uridine kinase [Saprospiraceae bacterium]
MKPLIIGICGGSGAGKTTLIRHLKARFSESELCVLSLDDYYYPRAKQKTDAMGVNNFDRPKSIDRKAFVKDLLKLISGESVSRQEYVFNNEQAKPRTLVFRPAPVIVVEGIFVFHFKKVRELLNLKVFLHAKENLKVIRRIKRDQVERNYPLEDVLYRYQHHVLPTFERYIRPYMEDADLIITNNEGFDNGLAVLTGFIRHYMQNPAHWHDPEF